MAGKQHVQLPNNMTKSRILTPKDLLVYVTIKSFMNKNFNACYPSLDTIVERSGVSKPTVRKSIALLEAEDYLYVTKDGRKNIYTFNPCKTFEPFSYEFIKDKNIDPNVKAYIIASQQLMFKDKEGFGKMTYSSSELAPLINLDKRTIDKYDIMLKQQGLLSIIKTNKVNEITGLPEVEKIFHLSEMDQSIIWALQKHEDDINELKEKDVKRDKDYEKFVNKIESFECEIKDKNKKIEILGEIIKEGFKKVGVEINLEEEVNKRINGIIL